MGYREEESKLKVYKDILAREEQLDKELSEKIERSKSVAAFNRFPKLTKDMLEKVN